MPVLPEEEFQDLLDKNLFMVIAVSNEKLGLPLNTKIKEINKFFGISPQMYRFALENYSEEIELYISLKSN